MVRQPLTVTAEIARTKRNQPDADTTPLYQELHEAKLTKFAQELAAKLPPLRADQRERLARLLAGGGNA